VFFLQLVAGKPLATSEERAEHIGPISGIPGIWLGHPQFRHLRPGGRVLFCAVGIAHIVPINSLSSHFFSYCQTIDGYPHE
jgi:hypothetical protein